MHMQTPRNDSIEAIEEYIDYVRGITHGPAQVAAAEIAVSYAERTKDTPTIYKARESLMTAAVFSGRPELALVHYSWMIATYDANPGIASEFMFLWQYKWVVSRLPLFPQISKAQIEQFLIEMEKRYTAFCGGQHAILRTKRGIYSTLCDIPAMKKAHREFLRSHRDLLSDCAACVANGNVGHYLGLRQYDKAFAECAPILEGRLRCASVPQSTYGMLLIPYLKKGRGAEAMLLHHRCMKIIANNPDYIDDIGRNILFLTLTANYAAAIKLLDRFIDVAYTATDPHAVYHFNLRIHTALIILLEADKTELKLRLTNSFPVKSTNGKFRTQELIDWYLQEITTAAKLYDARNGNDTYQREVNSFRRVKKYATPIPLRPAKE